MSQMFNEQALLLGRQQSLVGILIRPVVPTAADKPVIVILNTGIIHRVGHHRMFVTLSRSLATAGYTVLRFDFAGIGDSDSCPDGLAPLESCMADIKDALDWLERDGKGREAVLVGLCSGADHAILYGRTDPRVVGLVLMDPSIPPTARYYVHYIAERLMQWRNWLNVVTGRSHLLRQWREQLFRGGRRSNQLLAPSLQDIRFHPWLERSYQSAVDNGVQILGVFTRDSTRQTYPEQMIDAFPNVRFGDCLKLAYFPNSGHTFACKSDRSRLIRLIQGWVESRVAARARPH